MLKLGKELRLGVAWDEAGKSEVVQMLISHEDAKINSIQFVYAANGCVQHSKIHGQAIGSNFDMVTFDYPSEFLTKVRGEYDSNGLATIAFGTNKGNYGPFGRVSFKDDPIHDKFSYKFGPRSCFAGFHGNIAFSRVYTIGIYVKPIGSLLELDIEKNEKGATSKQYDSIIRDVTG